MILCATDQADQEQHKHIQPSKGFTDRLYSVPDALSDDT